MGLINRCKTGNSRFKGIESLYTDKCSIFRVESVSDGYGGTVEEEYLVSENNRCRLSQKTLSATGGNPVVASIQEFKLFLPIDIEIRQNDRLEVFRGSQKYVFRAGQPFVYYDRNPHQEIVLKEVIENED